MNWSTTLALAGQAAETAATPDSKGGFGLFPLILIIMALFYFMIARPQKRAQKENDDMRNSMKKGDRVKTIGGIIGTVVAVDTANDVISVQVDRNVKIDFDRNAIATVIKKEDAKKAGDTGKQKAVTVDAEPVEESETK